MVSETSRENSAKKEKSVKKKMIFDMPMASDG
jgi:hypothetical protein